MANSTIPFGFVGVHVGVGTYSVANEDEYKDACKDACLEAAGLLRDGKSAVDAVAAALIVLEDAPCTNAGMGSNLNMNGEVECDASLMDGQSLGFGAAGAVKGVRNPSQVAYQLLKEEIQGPNKAGLVPPIFLVGEGAADYAKHLSSIRTLPHASLITEKSRSAFNKSRAKLLAIENEEDADTPKKKRRAEDLCSYEDGCVGTVGVVCVDVYGNVSAGASSGGMLLKTPGRVGQAAMYGSGCWARNKSEGEQGGANIACCTTGCGEYLIKTLLAKECVELAKTRDGTNAVNDTLQDFFLGNLLVDNLFLYIDSPSLFSEERQNLAGLILLKMTERPDPCVEFVWGHNASSLCVGYMSTDHHKPKARISRSTSFDYHKLNPVLIEGIVNTAKR